MALSYISLSLKRFLSNRSFFFYFRRRRIQGRETPAAVAVDGASGFRRISPAAGGAVEGVRRRRPHGHLHARLGNLHVTRECRIRSRKRASRF